MGPFTRRLMQWIHEEGYCDEATRDKDWIDYANQLYDGREPIDGVRAAEADRRASSASTKTKAELLEAARRRRSCSSRRSPRPTRSCTSTQFEARDFLDDVDDDGARRTGRCTRPAPYVASTSVPPCASAGRPASASTPTRCWRAPARRRRRRPDGRTARRGGCPLDGVKVLDFTWAMAGPATTRVMADFGADGGPRRDRRSPRRGPHDRPVRQRRAGRRRVGPAVQHDDRQAQHRPRSPPARGAATCSTTSCAGPTSSSSRSRRVAAPRSSLDYQRLVELQPDLDHDVELPVRPDRAARSSTPGSARWAPRWPASSTSPAGPTGRRAARSAPTATTCRPASRCARCSAALDHRRRTGEGQYLDFAQAEAAVHFLTPGAARLLRQRPRRQRATATPTRPWRPTACTRAPATTSGWPSPAATTPTGRRWPASLDRPDLADLGRRRAPGAARRARRRSSAAWTARARRRAAEPR